MTAKRTTDERLAEAITLLDEATAGDWSLYFDDHSWDDDGRDDWMLAKSRSGPVTKGVVAEVKHCKEADAMLLSRAKSLVLLARDLAGERDAARLALDARAATTDRADR